MAAQEPAVLVLTGHIFRVTRTQKNNTMVLLQAFYVMKKEGSTLSETVEKSHPVVMIQVYSGVLVHGEQKEKIAVLTS